jgi:hypothetical protein
MGSCGNGTVAVVNSCGGCGASSFTPTVVFSGFADGGATAVLATSQSVACGYQSLSGDGDVLACAFDSLALQTYDAGYGASCLYAGIFNSSGSGVGGMTPSVGGTITLTSANPSTGLAGSYALNFCSNSPGSCALQGTFSAPACPVCP